MITTQEVQTALSDAGLDEQAIKGTITRLPFKEEDRILDKDLIAQLNADSCVLLHLLSVATTNQRLKDAEATAMTAFNDLKEAESAVKVCTQSACPFLCFRHACRHAYRHACRHVY